jgi:hypothetical protein
MELCQKQAEMPQYTINVSNFCPSLQKDVYDFESGFEVFMSEVGGIFVSDLNVV